MSENFSNYSKFCSLKITGNYFKTYKSGSLGMKLDNVWQGFSFIPLWIACRLQKAHAISEDSDQTAQMHRLI